MPRHITLILSPDDRTELERRARSRKMRTEDTRRAQVVLMLANGASFAAITARLGCYPDYINRWKHGTLSLYAALNTRTGEILGQTVPRHTSEAFVDFLRDIVATQPRRREIHVIVDNLSAHKTMAVHAFLAAHPQVHLHFTPTYASWLNQVELWFGKIERDLLARGIFTSLPDLARTIRRYITQYTKDLKPIRWTYADPTRRMPRPHRGRS